MLFENGAILEQHNARDDSVQQFCSLILYESVQEWLLIEDYIEAELSRSLSFQLSYSTVLDQLK